MQSKNIENKNPLSSGGVSINKDYVSFESDGDVAGVHMKIQGKGLIYRVNDDPVSHYHYRNNNFIMFNVSGEPLSEILFYFDGEIILHQAILVGFNKKQVFAFVDNKKSVSDEEKYMNEDLNVVDSSDDIILRKENRNKYYRGDSPKKIYKQNLRLVPRDNFWSYKAKLIDDIHEKKYRLFDTQELDKLKFRQDIRGVKDIIKNRRQDLMQIQELTNIKNVLESGAFDIEPVQEISQPNIFQETNYGITENVAFDLIETSFNTLGLNFKKEEGY